MCNADACLGVTRYREVMVVGEGLFAALLLTLRAVACGNVISLTLESNPGRSFSSFPDGRMCDAGVCLGVMRYQEAMVVGEGLFAALLLTLRAVACGNVISLTLESNPGRSFSSFPDGRMCDAGVCLGVMRYQEVMVVGEGFEPSKSMTADLQSAPFGRSGTPPGVKSNCSYSTARIMG